jgi:hypothetical protein
MFDGISCTMPSDATKKASSMEDNTI